MTILTSNFAHACKAVNPVAISRTMPKGIAFHQYRPVRNGAGNAVRASYSEQAKRKGSCMAEIPPGKSAEPRRRIME